MKFWTHRTTTQKIIIAVVIVMLFNFISPTISKAAGEGSAGGILFEPIKDLLLVVADGFVTLIQSILFGMDTSFVTIAYEHDWIKDVTRRRSRTSCSCSNSGNRTCRSTIFRRIKLSSSGSRNKNSSSNSYSIYWNSAW